jgi:dipeptidyl aminopeptidase/acylaminoacyl peptidase
MQDDLADGAKWMIASGVVDPKRICIAGASYGGYAALMGVMKDPDLFRCAVDWVGVTDINLLFTARWSDATESVKTYTMPTRVGDPVKYADYHKSVSPLVNAAKITQPLLMAYGTDDHRVPLVHGDEFYAAVKVHNKDVEYIKYPGEGHGWTLVPTRLDFWQRVEKFLDRQIGGATGGAGQGKGER